jgi:glycine cleavage system H protein
VKIAGDIYTPVDGKVANINKELEVNPQLVNDDANNTWIFEVTYDKQATGLLTEEEYKKIIA